jgi:hypothetical protein
MKRINKALIGIALASSLLASCVGGYYYVSARPVAPVYVRPVAPYPGAVWVQGEWEWRGGRYEYVPGYWARPRGQRVYVEGGWVTGPRGYYWRHGYWR